MSLNVLLAASDSTGPPQLVLGLALGTSFRSHWWKPSFPLWHPQTVPAIMAVIIVNKTHADVTAQASFYAPEHRLWARTWKHSFFVEGVQRSWVLTEMGDDAAVQCPKSRTGNKYLGHGPQTLARLCPTFHRKNFWSHESHTLHPRWSALSCVCMLLYNLRKRKEDLRVL